MPGIFLIAACTAYAKDKPAYQNGILLQMDSTSCGFAGKGSKTVSIELLGTDVQHQKTQEVLCQEYILQYDRPIFRIRPKDDKHAALLLIGESAQFRLQKDKIMLRVRETDRNEREYIVVSMTPRGDVAANQNAAKNAQSQ